MKNIALIDCRVSEKCRISLEGHGFSLISLPPFPLLDNSVKSHPDMLVFADGDRIISHQKYKEIAEAEFSLISKLRPNLEQIFSLEPISEKYPNDILFNACKIGNRIFSRYDFISSEIKKLAREKQYSIHNIRQGYSACSCLNIDENSIITSDVSLARAARECGISVLSIEKGHITLPFHDYGFIGGAGGVFDDKVFFLGNVDLHPNGDEIKEFIRKRGKLAVSLSDEPLADCGKIIFI